MDCPKQFIRRNSTTKIPFSHEILPDVNPSIAVLDNNEFKIIEINCLNSSGFYSR